MGNIGIQHLHSGKRVASGISWRFKICAFFAVLHIEIALKRNAQIFRYECFLIFRYEDFCNVCERGISEIVFIISGSIECEFSEAVFIELSKF